MIKPMVSANAGRLEAPPVRTAGRTMPSRRAVIAGMVAAIAGSTLPFPVLGNLGSAAAGAMTFERLGATMRAKAEAPYFAPHQAVLPDIWTDLDYDRYSDILFRRDRALWVNEPTLFRVSPHPVGGLFREPVTINDARQPGADSALFSLADFTYKNGRPLPESEAAVAAAGLRVQFPINRPDFFDEVISFLGSSYFRALGRGNVYGASARALAIDTGTSRPEEFPRFTDFYLSQPDPDDDAVTILAALDSPSVTGAFQFTITPGPTTEVAVVSRLYFRRDVAELGIAPLTSMFLYGPANRTGYNDFRPRVHDSEGLKIVGRDREVSWRPLNNPDALANSYFSGSPRSYGLHQRSRQLAEFEDPVANYHLRPSVDVIPEGDWGEGSVRLVELPTGFETEDNIVAYWRPKSGASAGEMLEHAYTMRWGFLPADEHADRAFVAQTSAGHSGVSGSPDLQSHRKFVIDFQGYRIGLLPSAADIEAVALISGGEILNIALAKVSGTDRWRAVIDVKGTGAGPMELSLHLAGFEQKLSETWRYQWTGAA